MAAGFLIGLLFFGAPWRLPPAWGDIPTWFLVVLAAVAAWAGLSQLRAIQQQMADEVRRNVKRDGLLDKQLAEVDARALADRRRQAEDVEVTWAGAHMGAVVNKSRRPISDVFCKVLSATDSQVVAVPDQAGLLEPVPLPSGRVTYNFVDPKPVAWWERLRPEGRCGFAFTGLQPGNDQLLVAWFTDDAGFRWQLDGYRHLVPAGHEDKCPP